MAYRVHQTNKKQVLHIYEGISYWDKEKNKNHLIRSIAYSLKSLMNIILRTLLDLRSYRSLPSPFLIL